MNFNDKDEDAFFNQHCLELAKLLRTEETEHFLRLYDSLPSEWNGARLETAKEHIRQLQELNDEQFELHYQRAFSDEGHHQTIIMSNPSAVIWNNDTDDKQTMSTSTRITSLSFLQQKQHHERMTANDLACDEKHDIPSKHSSAMQNPEESSTKTRRLQPITNNDVLEKISRTRTAVDTFVQLNLKPDINIKLEDYMKARDIMPSTKTSGSNHRSSNPQSIDTQEANILPSNPMQKCKSSSGSKSYEEASLVRLTAHEDQPDEHSRSSSSSSSTNPKQDQLTNGTLPSTNTSRHTTKSSSENSGSARTGSDSDDEQHQAEKKPLLSTIKSSYNNYDDTPTIVLSKTSENRTNQHDRISSLPDQHSYELVKLATTDEPPSLLQVPRLKHSVLDDPSSIHNSTNNSLPYITQRPQLTHFPSSSHQNRNPDHHDQYNTNHSHSSRKSSTRRTKKRKQSQQQEIIRTELIPGHRGDCDVDELVMFIDGLSSSKQRQNSTLGRSNDTNSNLHSSTTRRKSRKSSKIPQDNENKTSPIDEYTQSISFIDDDDDQTTTTTTTATTHSLTEQISLPHSDEVESHSHITNTEKSLPKWHSTSPVLTELDSLSLSSTILNNSNSELTSEPFVTVTHRRRLIKERRQDNPSLSGTSRFPDKRRFHATQNGILRPTISNIQPSVPTTTKEENTSISSPPTNSPSTSIANHVPEQLSPHLSSHSSSSSLSSLLKRQSKAPPVVFLNKSIDVELNDVSFGFDIDNPTIEKPPTPPPPSILPTHPSVPLEPSIDREVNPSSSSRRPYQQQNPRRPFYYYGSDIRPQQCRNYAFQSSYVDPLVMLQYNQQLAYSNLFRAPCVPSQSPYVLIPTNTTPYERNSDQKDQTSEQVQEPLLFYATIPGQTGPIYYQTTKKSSFQSMYPSQYFYPTHPAYFQPISSPVSLSLDTKSQQDGTDNDDGDEEEEQRDEDNGLEKSRRIFEQTRQQSSSHIMSNALQLVYSQEKRNAPTDRFNLDQLTAYLAMKWTDTTDHYQQGDDEILLTGEQP